MIDIRPYLSFEGTCKEALEFYLKVLGGKMAWMMTYAESPMAKMVPPDQGHKVIHARIEVEGQTIAAADTPPGRYVKPQGFWISIDIEDPERAQKIFDELGAGGQVVVPMAETFWAKRFGMFYDKYGTPWMVNCGKQP